jgi:hypothetical protein
VVPHRLLALSVLFVFLSAGGLCASEIDDGYIRLVINERTGSFSLFFLSDSSAGLYEPLFYSRDPSTSYLSVSLDGRVYRLGQSRDFRVRLESNGRDSTVVFESPFLTVSETFTPVKTGNSEDTNGVKITVTVQNASDKAVSAGLRMLIDTHLGEDRGGVPFTAGRQLITGETIIEGASGERFWISRGQNLSLMGSIVNPLDSNSRVPDYIHMANWKRLNDVPWILRYSQGRSFNNLLYSVRDSAVCYYYEPALLESGESFSYTVFLTTEDIEWYNGTAAFDIASFERMIIEEAAKNEEDADLLMLYRLQEILYRFIAGEINITERDIIEIEESVNRLKAGH